MSGSNANGTTQQKAPKSREDYEKQLVKELISIGSIINKQERSKGPEKVSIGFSLDEVFNFIKLLIAGGNVGNEEIAPMNFDGLIADDGINVNKSRVGDIMDRIKLVLTHTTANKISVTTWSKHNGECLRPIAALSAAAGQLVQYYLPEEHEAVKAEKRQEQNAKRSANAKAAADEAKANAEQRWSALVEAAEQLKSIQTSLPQDGQAQLQVLMNAVSAIANSETPYKKRKTAPAPAPAPADAPADAPAPTPADAPAPATAPASMLTIGALMEAVTAKIHATRRGKKAPKALTSLKTRLDSLLETHTLLDVVPEDVMKDHESLIDALCTPVV